MSRWLTLSGAVLAWSVAACFSDAGITPPPAPDRKLEQVSTASLEVDPGAVVPGPIVRVTEAGSGKPVADVTVEFKLRPESGSIENVVARTDAHGLASAGRWTLPVRAGRATLDVQTGGLRILFSALVKPGAPASLRASDTTIAWIAGEEAPGPAVEVVDKFGNPIDGLQVTFAVTSGGGQLARSEAVTSNGRAYPGRWRLGDSPGMNTITAAYAGMPPVTTRTLGIDRSLLVWYDLDRVGGLPLTTIGVTRGTMGFTKFDPCLCGSDTGYFMIEAGLRDAADSIPGVVRLAGRYRVSAQQLQLLSDGGELRRSPEGRADIIMIRDQARTIQGGSIGLEVWRFYPAGPEWWLQVWTFHEAPR
jgi:hypothetical protein